MMPFITLRCFDAAAVITDALFFIYAAPHADYVICYAMIHADIMSLMAATPLSLRAIATPAAYAIYYVFASFIDTSRYYASAADAADTLAQFSRRHHECLIFRRFAFAIISHYYAMPPPLRCRCH